VSVRPKRPGSAPRLAVTGLVLAIAGIVLAAVLLSSSDEKTARPRPVAPALTGSGHPNVDQAGTRRVGGPITRATVGRLRPAWSRPAINGGFGAPPVIAHGVMYAQDRFSDVSATDVQTGKLLWASAFKAQTVGPNGVVVAEGKVYGATPTAAFALDQKTGRKLWSVALVRNAREGIDMAPGYHDGLVYVSTVPVTLKKYYGGGAVGVLWALDARTGKKAWHFDTVPRGLWSTRHRGLNAGGGLWYPPSFDDQGGMYFGVGNPGPYPGTRRYPWGSSRPGPNLYTDSLVKLDAATGRMRWHYQLTPHDLYDWDLQDSPVLTKVNGRDAAITAGKAGIVIAVDRETGRLLWKRSVGKHNGHDKDSVYAMRRQYSKLETPEEIYPGSNGGGVIAPMATDGKTLFVPIVDQSAIYSAQTRRKDGATASGQLVAIDLTNGSIRWALKLPAPAFGATTVVNDVVFATSFDGTVWAADTQTGELLWHDRLPASTDMGVAVAGDTVIATGGFAVAPGQKPAIVAYRLAGTR
jgi:outer membrane protein assembly factor BamB